MPRMPTAAPVFANVAFLRIPRFDDRAVVDQASLKERLERRVREAIAGMPAAERIVLDAADGVAWCSSGSPRGPWTSLRRCERRRARSPSRWA